MLALYIIIGLFTFLLLLAFILPGKYSISKSIIINADISKCYDLVADLNNYSDWNPWSKMEPNAQKNISGTPKTIGHQYAWEGKKIGMGGLTILAAEPNKSVNLEIMFIKPFNSKASDDWTFEQLPNNQIKVTWANKGDLPVGMARLMGPMITKNLNQQFQQGLTNIKELCEK